ncbi:hypothetical protein Aspvir_001809 [Aspergillus viridinutans]|uniref:Uncharacterized protein n=1 Tax=Aspergillus viridinutans TaxID=75553 RepID=A0A9P3C1K7_ASPVI|nr:uncharacterized protein Aspvir_001809 [Aspergillus viridinutans]GIK06165.1 hypothetical protein Aspvir_001809 [Aspergillus viridinutans]
MLTLTPPPTRPTTAQTDQNDARRIPHLLRLDGRLRELPLRARPRLIHTLPGDAAPNPYQEQHLRSAGGAGGGRGRDGGASSHVIVLEDVLHIPEAVCNGFNPLLYGSSMSCNMEYWEGADRRGEPVWFAVPYAGGTRLVLAGEPRGESELIQGRYYTLSLSITPQERREIFEAMAC